MEGKRGGWRDSSGGERRTRGRGRGLRPAKGEGGELDAVPSRLCLVLGLLSGFPWSRGDGDAGPVERRGERRMGTRPVLGVVWRASHWANWTKLDPEFGLARASARPARPSKTSSVQPDGTVVSPSRPLLASLLSPIAFIPSFFWCVSSPRHPSRAPLTLSYTAYLSMDAFHCDAYTTYSDASTPRTPSPRTADNYIPSPAHYKLELEPVTNIFADNMSDEHAVAPEGHSIWHGMNASSSTLR